MVYVTHCHQPDPLLTCESAHKLSHDSDWFSCSCSIDATSVQGGHKVQEKIPQFFQSHKLTFP